MMNPRGRSRSSAASVVGRELAGLLEVPRLVVRSPQLLRKPRGDGLAVLVLPGRSVDDTSTLPLRSYLRFLGHAPAGWDLGVNDGDLSRLVPLVAARAAAMADRAGRPIPLVGQSMGGSIARQAARRCPGAVSRVITIGSPIMGPQDRRPQACPVTAIYSRADQVVPPRWALAAGDDVEVVEVASTHFSMGIDPDVWSVVADRLASSRDRRTDDDPAAPPSDPASRRP